MGEDVTVLMFVMGIGMPGLKEREGRILISDLRARAEWVPAPVGGRAG